MKRFICVWLAFMSLLLAGCRTVTDKTESAESTEGKAAVTDYLSGKTLTARDGSVLHLGGDGSYIWYQNDSVTDDNYYKGSYEIYTGEKAIAIMSSMAEYGVTEQEQQALLSRNADKGITVNDWYVMVQTRTYRKVSGKESGENTKIVYMGIYYKEQNTYDSVNCNTGNYAIFTVE